MFTPKPTKQTLHQLKTKLSNTSLEVMTPMTALPITPSTQLSLKHELSSIFQQPSQILADVPSRQTTRRFSLAEVDVQTLMQAFNTPDTIHELA